MIQAVLGIVWAALVVFVVRFVHVATSNPNDDKE